MNLCDSAWLSHATASGSRWFAIKTTDIRAACQARQVGCRGFQDLLLRTEIRSKREDGVYQRFSNALKMLYVKCLILRAE